MKFLIFFILSMPLGCGSSASSDKKSAMDNDKLDSLNTNTELNDKQVIDVNKLSSNKCSIGGTKTYSDTWSDKWHSLYLSKDSSSQNEVRELCKSKFGLTNYYTFLRDAEAELRAKNCPIAIEMGGECAPCASDSVNCPCNPVSIKKGWIICFTGIYK